MDPVETIVADGLAAAGIAHRFGHDVANGLDFYLPDFDVYVEVKRFHSGRIAEQMARAENVIAIQGVAAARLFAKLVGGSSK